jgi:hypothetical protein
MVHPRGSGVGWGGVGIVIIKFSSKRCTNGGLPNYYYYYYYPRLGSPTKKTQKKKKKKKKNKQTNKQTNKQKNKFKK